MVDNLAPLQKTRTLNIKDPEAHRLAAAIAQETGETLTAAVLEALRQRLDTLKRKKRRATFEELLALADRIAADVKRPYVDHAELLYDERGLPK